MSVFDTIRHTRPTLAVQAAAVHVVSVDDAEKETNREYDASGQGEYHKGLHVEKVAYGSGGVRGNLGVRSFFSSGDGNGYLSDVSVSILSRRPCTPISRMLIAGELSDSVRRLDCVGSDCLNTCFPAVFETP
jgi:hypothetical protein